MRQMLKINSLVKKFGGLTATNDVSFSINQGQSIALIGPNGAGKTTIFSQIMGEHRQTSGSISLFDQEITDLSTAQRIGLGVSRTYQIPRPFSELSIVENIRIGLMSSSIKDMIFQAPDTDKEIEIAMSVGFREADLSRKPSELSMGDLRKLEMARTMATNPSLMLLDEVFAGLTYAEIGQISKLIQKMRSDGMTFLIVSHDLKALVPLVDHAIAINYGKVIAHGTMKETLADEAVRASYLGT